MIHLEFETPASVNGTARSVVHAIEKPTGRVIFTDRGDLFDQAFRSRFIRGVVGHLPANRIGPETLRALEILIDRLLCQKIEELRALAGPPGAAEPRDPFPVSGVPRPHFSDLGNARRLVRLAAGGLRFCHAWGDFLVYDGKRWVRDTCGAAERLAKQTVAKLWIDAEKLGGYQRAEALKWAHRSEAADRIRSMLALARSEPEVAVSPAQLDSDPWVLNVKNGTVDLRSGRLREHGRGDLITKLADVEFQPDAEAPQWQRFTARITDGDRDLAGYLARVLGLALTGDISVQQLWIFYGGGANGKSVLLDTVAELLGDYAGLAAPGLLTSRHSNEHPTELADLQGKRLVIASESDEEASLRLRLVKRLTGDARIKARFMRQDFFEFPRTHKTVLVTNNRPVVHEATNAVWRRIRLVPFTVTIPAEEQDPALMEKLRTERRGILAWLVCGCLEWQRSGLEPAPAVVEDATGEYRDEEDPLLEYLRIRLVLRGNARVSRPDLWQDYESYCVQLGEHHPVSRKALYAAVRRQPGVTADEWRPAGTSIPVRGFRGVALAARDFTGGST